MMHIIFGNKAFFLSPFRYICVILVSPFGYDEAIFDVRVALSCICET